MLRFLILFLFSTALYSQVLPPVKYPFYKNVFVDFEKAHYTITIDLDQDVVTTESTIELVQNEKGHIVFDLKKPCLKVEIDGVKARTKTFLIPSSFGFAKTILKKTDAGRHTLKVTTRLKKGIDFKNEFELGFWIRDLIGRKFLEQYLPTSFEYDQYKATMNINIIGSKSNIVKDYTLMANGDVTKTGRNYFIDFPEFYTASSFFIHIFETGKYIMKSEKFTRLDGKTIDLITYSDNQEFTQNLFEGTLKSVKELEAIYGTWPHDYLIVFGDDVKGGMEHAGATQTSLRSLDHELHHSYFSKSVIPRNGNAGWMDEAIVTWRDDEYPLVEKMSYKKHNLACHSVHRRSTDWDSYEKGGEFIAHLAYLFSLKGIDFNTVLRDYYQTYKYQIVETSTFQSFIEKSYGESLAAKFNQYVYKKKRCRSSKN